MTVTRSLSYKLYPSPAQEQAMEAKRLMLKDLWNAALEERIGAWRRSVRVTRSDQEKALKEIRRDLPGWHGLVHTHEAQGVLKRLDLAFQAFFRRAAAGQKPGFPRFRSADRFRGWSYKEHGNGFRVALGEGGHNGHIRLFGIGRMRMRGRARTPGRVLKADVVKTVRGWMLNLVVETGCAERAPVTGPAAGLDWGVSDFATIAVENGGYAAVPNPRHLSVEADSLKAEGRKLSAAARARRISGRALRKHRRSLARRHAKVAARRKDFLHKVTTRLAASHRMIMTEALTVRNMTASARGTIEDPGRNVAQKAGLNRSILDTAPATFLNMLRYKAEEAGSEFLLAPTRRLKPSQRCPACGTLQRKRLDERVHACSCGCRLGRDEAAARVLLNHGLACEAARQDRPAGTAGASRNAA
jgi:putative transposase